MVSADSVALVTEGLATTQNPDPEDRQGTNERLRNVQFLCALPTYTT